MVSFEIFVKAMLPSLSELKVLPSFCFAFKIPDNVAASNKYVKFGLFEKHTKFEKNLPHCFDKSVDLLSKRQNHEEDFFKLCVLLKKSEL